MDFKDLINLCKPIYEFLKKHYDPHCSVVISWNEIKIVRDEIGTPIEEVGQN